MTVRGTGGEQGVPDLRRLPTSPPADSCRGPRLLILLLAAAAALSGCVSSAVSSESPALTMMPIAARPVERPAVPASAPRPVATASGRDPDPFRAIAGGDDAYAFRLPSPVPGTDWCTWFGTVSRAAIDGPPITGEPALPVMARALDTTASVPRRAGAPLARVSRPTDAVRKAPFLDTAVSVGAIVFLVVVLLVPAGCALASGFVQPMCRGQPSAPETADTSRPRAVPLTVLPT